MITLALADDSDRILERDEKRTVLTAIALVLEAHAPPQDPGKPQLVRLAPSMPEVGDFGEPMGYANPKTGDITLNAGKIVRGHPRFGPLPPHERMFRLIMTAAHEAAHTAQTMRDEVRPSDEEALLEYDDDAWYEVEARNVSAEILKGYFPQITGVIPLGIRGPYIQIPAASRFTAAWASFAAGTKPWRLDKTFRPVVPLPRLSR